MCPIATYTHCMQRVTLGVRCAVYQMGTEVRFPQRQLNARKADILAWKAKSGTARYGITHFLKALERNQCIQRDMALEDD